MIPVSMGTSVNFCKIIPYPINRVYIPPGMVWYGIVCNVIKKGNDGWHEELPLGLSY